MKHSRLYKICKNPLGFTLVELVVVIALLAILTVSVMPSLRNNITETSDNQRKSCYDDVVAQVSKIVSVYNDAVQAGNTPRLAGFNLSSARGMQECLRYANNHSDIYEVELTTVAGAPDGSLYNLIDTIVVCIQFYTKDNQLIKNSNGVACSPELSGKATKAYSCKCMGVWYVKKETASVLYSTQSN